MSDPDPMPFSERRRALLHKLLADKGVTAQARPAIAPAPEGEAPPLSFAQERMWFFEQLTPGTAVYNLPAVVRLRGSLDHGALQQAIDAALGRHSALHVRFGSDRGRPTVHAGDPRSFPLAYHDLTDLSTSEGRARANDLVLADLQAPFDLSEGPLARLTLVRLGAQEHILALTMHHIAGDAWSWDIILREVAAAYETPQIPLPAERLQYQDYARWQRVRYDSGELSTQLDYWRRQLSGVPAPLALPSDRVRPAAPRFRGGVVHFDVTPDQVSALREIGRRENATLFMVTLAVFNLLLYRYTAQTDLVVGTPVANREQAEVQSLVGLLVNTLLMRTRLGPRQTFRELVREVRRTATDAFANQDIAFEKLVEELAPVRGSGLSPFFQVMFAFRAAPATRELSSLQLERVDIHSGVAKRDLTLQLVETDHGMHGQIEFDADLFDLGTVQRLAGHYRRLVEAAASGPDVPVAMLPMVTTAEQEALSRWSSGGPVRVASKRVHERVTDQAGRTPDAVAVVSGHHRLTYAELEQASDRLAAALVALGVRPESAIGIHLDRSADLVVAVLGVLKTGAAYVPVDVADPLERRLSILDDAGAVVVVSRTRLDDRRTVVDPAEVPEADPLAAPVPADPAARAYILYTSGSTGRPKGVIIEHRQLSGYLDAIIEWLDLTEPMAYAMVQPLTVDSCLTALFPPLMSGGVLHVIPQHTALDAAALADYVAANAVDVLKIAPSHLRALQRSGRFRQIVPRQRLVVGGEASAWEWMRQLQELSPDCRVVNHYGPTEATVGVTTFHVADHLDEAFGVTPLGYPLPGTEAYVLDEHLQPLPVGVPGELYLGGTNIARGYAGRPKRTAEAFVADPFAGSGQRLYRTGDVVRRLASGAVDFLGRRDDQVKIRGFRVEIGEIESVIRAHASVADAVVAVRSDGGGEPLLVAYVVGAGTQPSPADLQAYARSRIPHHMIPSAFVPIDALPLSSHGKVDRSALPGLVRPDTGVRAAAPATETQRTVWEIWCRLLGTDRVGIDENFFEAGGHSLLLVRLHHELQEAAGQAFPLVELFNATTVAAQADLLGRQDRGAAALRTGLERGRKQSELLRRRRKAMKASGGTDD